MYTCIHVYIYTLNHIESNHRESPADHKIRSQFSIYSGSGKRFLN